MQLFPPVAVTAPEQPVSKAYVRTPAAQRFVSLVQGPAPSPSFIFQFEAVLKLPFAISQDLNKTPLFRGEFPAYMASLLTTPFQAS